MKKILLVFLCLILTSCAPFAFISIDKEGFGGANGDADPEINVNIYNQKDADFFQYVRDMLQDVSQPVFDKLSGTIDALKGSNKKYLADINQLREENKKKDEQYRDLQEKLNKVLEVYGKDIVYPGDDTHDPEMTESDVLENLDYYKRTNGNRPTFWGDRTKVVMDYPDTFWVVCENGFKKLISDDNLVESNNEYPRRHQEGSFVVKGAESRHGRLAVILPEEQNTKTCYVKAAVATGEPEKTIYRDSKKYDTLRGNNADDGMRKGVALTEGQNQQPFDECSVDGHVLPVHSVNDGKRYLWDEGLEIEEGTVVCTKGNEEYQFEFKTGCVHRGEFRPGGIKDEC